MASNNDLEAAPNEGRDDVLLENASSILEQKVLAESEGDPARELKVEIVANGGRVYALAVRIEYVVRATAGFAHLSGLVLKHVKHAIGPHFDARQRVAIHRSLGVKRCVECLHEVVDLARILDLGGREQKDEVSTKLLRPSLIATKTSPPARRRQIHGDLLLL